VSQDWKEPNVGEASKRSDSPTLHCVAFWDVHVAPDHEITAIAGGEEHADCAIPKRAAQTAMSRVTLRRRDIAIDFGNYSSSPPAQNEADYTPRGRGAAVLRKSSRIAVAVGVIVLAIGCAHLASSDPRDAVDAFVRAFNNLSVNEVGDLLDDDATAFLPFASSAQRIAGRDQILAALRPLFEAEQRRASGPPPYLHLVARDIHVQRLSAGSAVVSFDVGNERVHSRRTLVLSLIAGRWRIVHLHASNVRPE